MILDDVWTLFSEKLFFAPSTPSLFNQYNNNESNVDLPGGNEIRRENLLNYLRSFTKFPSIVVIGEAPGWRGCRFSGIPFTSEAQLLQDGFPIGGHRSSLRDSPYAEATATLFWRRLSAYHPHFFAWNCIPFHPHEEGKQLSNRTPSRGEIEAHSEFLSELLELLQPEQVVALGRSAESALNQSGVPSVYVRHPSRGGAKLFREGIGSLFKSCTPLV